MRFSKKVVISAIIAVIGYTVIVLVFAWFEKFPPAELTVGWFTFWGVEVAALMTKSVTEIKQETILKQMEECEDDDRSG